MNILTNPQKFIDFCYNEHDVTCNQKYNKTLPYSFHLKAVEAQAKRYLHLFDNHPNSYTKSHIFMACAGHDTLEDCHTLTYNDILSMTSDLVADIIYACTELRGHNRGERHGIEYFETLKHNKLAIFVKLCDIMANVTMSMLTNSKMYKTYQNEFAHLKSELYCDEYKIMFDDLENLLNIYK
jgi:hypothetical protein